MSLLPNESKPYEWHRGDLTVSTDRERLDVPLVCRFLSEESYWSEGIDKVLIEKALRGSLVFGIYASDGAQIGFARVVTDGVFFAYLRDVFILPEWRGRGLGTWLSEAAVQHPDLQGVKNWMLSTQDAHDVYAKIGFHPLHHPESYMQIIR